MNSVYFMDTVYFGKFNFEIWEFVLLPVYLFIIWFISAWIKNSNIEKKPEYQYFMPGLWLKIIGSIILGLIYVYYYQGGDTMGYYQSGLAFTNLFYQRPVEAVLTFISPATSENLSHFNTQTGYPLLYLYQDIQTFTVIRLITPLLVISFKSYIITAVMLAWISYYGIWKIYRLFVAYYPELRLQIAIGFLFFPSVWFWGSGILKDTFTFSATCLFVYTFHNIFIKRRKALINIIWLIISMYLLLAIKPYIVIVLLPGSIIWIFFNQLTKIRNQLLIWILIPCIYLFSVGGGFIIFKTISDQLGEYSIENIFTKAVVTQQDLKKEYYGGNSYDIGNFDPTVSGVLSKFPIATISGLYRPFIWETSNIMMLFSGLESLFLMFLTIWTLFKVGVLQFIRITIRTPLLVFTLSFSLLMAFAMGLTTPNFGALVRFKIPLLPFFISSMFIFYHICKIGKKHNIS